MKKILLLSSLIALLAPVRAHALLTNDEILSYAAMPLAVSDVCDVRGVQTDQVGTLVSYMDEANVPPDQFIDVFRYVPVALTFNTGRNPDFVQWVGDEVRQGVSGDQLVTVMEQHLTSYGNVVTTARTYRLSRHRHRYDRPIYYSAYEPDYIPQNVVRYVDDEMLDPFALIDEPVAVANVVDLGVPIARIGNFVLQLDLGGVAPLQTVEVLRYAPTALVAPAYYNQPDFVQYVYDQRVAGVTGYNLIQAVDQQLPAYGVYPQVDMAPPVYVAPNVYVPATVNDYVQPVDPTWIPPAVRTQVATFAAPSQTNYAAPGGPAYAPQPTAVSPQTQRLLAQQGSPVVTNPGQARRELAQQIRAQRQAARMPAGISPAPAPQFGNVAPSQIAVANGHGRGRAMRMAQAPAVAPAPAPIAAPHGRGRAMQVAQAPPAMHARPQMMRQRAPQAVEQHGHGRPQFAQRPVMAAPRPQAQRAPVMAQPQPQFVPQGRGQGHGRGNGGGPPARVMAPPPAPAAVAPAPAPQGPPPGRGNGNGNGNGHGGKKGKGE